MTAPKAPTNELPDWPRLMPPPLAASYLGVSPGLLDTLGLPSAKVRGRRLYDRQALDRWADGLKADNPISTDDFLARLDE